MPKGEHDPGEDSWAAAIREFKEETGVEPPDGVRFELGEEKQRSRKRISAFALEGYVDASSLRSSLCSVEWPPRSGREQSVPEVDRAEWFPISIGNDKIAPGQRLFLDRLVKKLQL
jgi:predicted NUDIX family NTP pyrophosphohydrolase